MSKVKDAIAEHCERYCVPTCDNCHWFCEHDDMACGVWECGRESWDCYADAQAAEADRIHDARMEGDR